MLLIRKDAEHFQNTVEELENIREVLEEQGSRDGKSRYLEIMAELMLLVEKRLCALHALFGLQFGLLLALLIKLLLAGG